MPSDLLKDARVQRALAALAHPIGEFRSLVEDALVQAEALLAAQTADAPARAARASAELGAFANGRLDAAKFAALFPPAPPADDWAMAALRAAVAQLKAVRARGDELFVVQVPAKGRLGATVDAALADAGRAFGAVVVAELVRGGRYVKAEHERLLDAMEFRAWNRAERRFAPPLVVVLDGSALAAAELAPFTDGREKIVLVAQGACPPAPLARCITPGTFVVQTCDGSGLDRLAAYDGPAIGALLPEGGSVFVHDPALGREAWQRLAVAHLGEAPKKPIGSMSAWQMTEDLRLLESLARTPFAVPTAGNVGGTPAVGSNDAADRIASWLLGESGLNPGRAGA